MFPSEVTTVPTVPTFFSEKNLRKLGGSQNLLAHWPREITGYVRQTPIEKGGAGEYGGYGRPSTEGEHRTHLPYPPFLQFFAK